MKFALSVLAPLALASSAIARVIPARELLIERDVATDFPNPAVDPFYQEPKNLSSYAKGAVIRSRPVNTTVSSSDLASAYQVYYASRNTQGEPSATVTTVFYPKKPLSPAKILSVQIYEDSASDCAPSWAFVAGSASAGKIATSLDIPIYIASALESGAYVSAPDHEGAKSSFIAGRQEGQASLDGVKALISQAKLPKDTGVVGIGYSGGGHASVWFAALAGSYSPSLNILGVAHGGTPTDLLSIINFINKTPFSGFVGAGLLGVASAYPELKAFIDQHITEAGKKLLAQYTASGYCLDKVVAGGLLGTDFFSSTYFNISDPLNAPLVKKIFAQESLLKNVSSSPVPVPSFPTFQFHADADEIVPLAPHEQFVKEQCAAGAQIQYTRVPGEHILGEIFGLVPTIQFVKQAFNGTIPKTACGTSAPVPAPNSPEAKQILGVKIAAQVAALNGKVLLGGQVVKF